MYFLNTYLIKIILKKQYKNGKNLKAVLIGLRMSNNINGRKQTIYDMAIGKLPTEIIKRRKYGFCNALDEIEEMSQ